MREVSEDAAWVLTGSHPVTATLGVYYDGEPVIDELPVTDGTLEADGTAEVQQSLSVTVPRMLTTPTGDVLDLLPTGPASPLGCEGQQVTLSYAIGLPNGAAEQVAMGWFRVAEWAEGDGVIELSCTSLEALLAEARFLYPTTIKPRTGYRAAATRLVEDLLPLDMTADNARVTGTQTFEDERLAALYQLVGTWPARMWVDDGGVLVIAPPTDDATDPVVFSLTDGENGTVVEVPTSGGRDGIYNAVKASGEESGNNTPVSAVAYLSDGPRRWNGPYGNVPYFYVSPLLTTKARARSAARTRLRNLQRLAEPVEVTAAPDPRIQLGDVGRLRYADRDVLMRVDKLTLPVTAEGGPMSVSGHLLPTRKGDT